MQSTPTFKDLNRFGNYNRRFKIIYQTSRAISEKCEAVFETKNCGKNKSWSG